MDDYAPQIDPWLELIERFAARGAMIRGGNVLQDMTKHLLDTLEEQDVRIRGLEDAIMKLRKATAE